MCPVGAQHNQTSSACQSSGIATINKSRKSKRLVELGGGRPGFRGTHTCIYHAFIRPYLHTQVDWKRSERCTGGESSLPSFLIRLFAFQYILRKNVTQNLLRCCAILPFRQHCMHFVATGHGGRDRASVSRGGSG